MRVIIYIILTAICLPSCVKSFNPVSPEESTDYLVVDGQILSGAETIIKLSRTRPLNDSSSGRPEKDATVIIESESGETFYLLSSSDGVYTSTNSQVNNSGKYRLRVITSAGKNYLSDYVNVKETPAIDSLQWIQDGNINIYLNTHDPSDNTRYYRWEYIETYEYHAYYQSFLDFQNDEVVYLEPEQYRNICYTTDSSTAILLGSSAALQNDVISLALITSIPNDNTKISYRYSILVKQYALTPEAYNYWQIIKQNSQPNGDIFDPQPSQLYGNIHCVEDPDEPVVGFICASSVTEKRIFILWGDLPERTLEDNKSLCRETFVERQDAPKFLRDGAMLPAYFVSGGPLAIASAICVDCRLRGGVTQKPSFW